MAAAPRTRYSVEGENRPGGAAAITHPIPFVPELTLVPGRRHPAADGPGQTRTPVRS
jgi:hypothetical protein